MNNKKLEKIVDYLCTKKSFLVFFAILFFPFVLLLCIIENFLYHIYFIRNYGWKRYLRKYG